MTTAMTLELREEERDYLLSMGRCRLCDHLGNLHNEGCTDLSSACDTTEVCLIPDCECTGLR